MKLRHATIALSVLAFSGLVIGAYAQKSGGLRSSPQSAKTKRKISGAQLVRARAEWFFRQRAYPLSHIPAFARERAWNDFRHMQDQQRQYFLQKYGPDYRRQMAALAVTTSAPIVTNPWTTIGPQPTNAFFNQPDVSGRVTALAVDPCDSTGNTVFLGGAQGGLWKTTDGGLHWAIVGNQSALPSLAVGSLAVPPASAGCVGSPSTSKTIYVGTGEENFSFDSYYGAGVLTCATSDGSNYSCTPDQTLGAFNTSNPLTPDSGGPFIGGLAVDPQNPSILLAAVQGFQSTLPSGIWCSANGGSIWTRVLPGAGTFGEVGTAVAFDQAGFAYAAIGNTNGAGSSNGVYGSTTAYASSCSPTYSALTGLSNLAGGASAMGRISFSVHSTSATNPSSDEIFAVVANASDDSSTLKGVFKSTDGGNSWMQLTDPLTTTSGGYCNDQCFYDLPITIDPHNANVIYAGGSAPGSGVNGEGNTLIASTDGGNTWTDVADNSSALIGIHVDAHAIAFKSNGSAVYVGTDGGVWSATSPESLSNLSAWNDLNSTLGLTQIYTGMSNNPSGWQYRSYLGSQDNGTQVLAPDLLTFSNFSGSSLAWDDTLSCGDGGVTLVDPLIPSTVYGECSYIPGFLLGIEKSLFNGNVDVSNDASGGGSTYFEASSGINASDDGSFIPPFAIDPNQTGSTGDAQTLYFGTYRVWQTTSGGSSWNAISPDVSGASAVPASCSGSNISTCFLTALAVAPTSSNEVVTGSSVGHVFLTTNALQGVSSTWTDVTGVGMLPDRDITQVAVDPSNANTLYATFSGFSGFNGDTKGHVFAGDLTPTGTPAVAWTDVSGGTLCPTGSGNLPNIPVNSIVIDPDPAEAGTLYVGTDIGVYVGALQGTAPAFTGACWQPLGTGLPNSAVLSLSLNEASRTLIAGTHGRSAWALQLSGVPAFALTSLNPASANAGSGLSSLTLDGNGFTPNSTVNWTVNGSTPSGCIIPTPTSQTATQLTITNIPSACFAGGIAQVSVSDPSETNPTNSLSFTITSNTPTVTNISPSTGASNNPLNLTLQGTNFIPNATTIGLASIVSPLPCSPVTQAPGGSATQITASISASCLQFGGIYFVTANNPPPGGGSSNPTLTAAPSPFGGGCNNSNPAGCLIGITGPAPSNQSLANATNIGSNTFTTTEDTSGAANGNGPTIPSTCTTVNPSGISNDSGDYKSVWFKYTPTTNVTAEIDTVGSNYDTILSVWTESSGSGNLFPLPGAPPTRPSIYLLLAVTLCAFLLTFALRRSRPFSQRFGTGLAFALLAGSLTFLGACGGGGGGSIVVPPPSPKLTSVACNDDIVQGVTLPSQISNLSLSANTTYFFLVSDWGVPVDDSSGNTTAILASGGKLVLNLNAH